MSKMPDTAEKPGVWVYTLSPIEHTGSTLLHAEVKLTDLKTLRAKALSAANPFPKDSAEAEEFQKDYSPSFLLTNGGLEHPALVYSWSGQLPFSPEFKPIPIELGQKLDVFSFTAKRDEVIGRGVPLPKQFSKARWEIWAMNQYPTKKGQISWGFPDRSSPLFDPSAEPEKLADSIARVYRDLLEYYPPLRNEKFASLLWSLDDQGDQFRLVTRLHRLASIDKEGNPVKKNAMWVGTTIPKSQLQPQIA